MTSLLTSTLLPLMLACGGQPASELEQPAPPPEPHVLERESGAVTLPVQGTINLITMKNGTVEVPGRFERVAGEITLSDVDAWQGIDGEVTVDLSSWNSDLELRDSRVKELFFEVADYGEATLSLSGLTGLSSAGLPVNSTVKVSMRGQLALHGATRDLSIPVAIKRTGREAFQVTTPEPFEVKISEFDYGEPLAALIKECAHESISDVVKVSVDLMLGQTAEIPAEKLEVEKKSTDGAPPADAPVPPAGKAGKGKAGG